MENKSRRPCVHGLTAWPGGGAGPGRGDRSQVKRPLSGEAGPGPSTDVCHDCQTVTRFHQVGTAPPPSAMLKLTVTNTHTEQISAQWADFQCATSSDCFSRAHAIFLHTVYLGNFAPLFYLSKCDLSFQGCARLMSRESNLTRLWLWSSLKRNTMVSSLFS